MSKISIKRSSQYENKLRAITIYLDGIKLGEIADGETKDFEVVKGNHTLVAKIDWATSNTINFDIDNYDLEFNLRGTTSMFALYNIIFGRKKYLKLELI